MQAFEYANPATLQEALGLLGKRWGEVDVLAGGTDLLGLMKDDLHTPKRLVNIKSIKDLGGIQKSAEGLRIGALVTIDDLTRSAELKNEYPALFEAARGVGGPQIRNMGTVGGNLCQRPRCWYFRLGYGILAQQDGKSLVPEGDNRYHAIFGNQGPAYFVSPSSLAPALVAFGAKVKLASPKGVRELPIEKFFVAPQSQDTREIALLPNEILTEVIIPPAGGARSATHEIRQKEALDWALASASVVLKMSGNTVSSARVVLGAVAPTPWAAVKAEKLLARKVLTAAVAEQAAEAAVDGATPLSQNAYKAQLARVAVKRALLQAARGKA
jgi:xanthine dehydrogenase YagS FAD-binding subunit